MIAAIVGRLDTLIATSVFFMAIAYVATSASIFSLRRKGAEAQFHLKGGFLIPSLGVIFSIYLITQCAPTQIALGVALLLAGVPMYIKYSPKKEISELKEALVSRESRMKRTYSQEERFLANVLRHIKRLYRKVETEKQT